MAHKLGCLNGPNPPTMATMAVSQARGCHSGGRLTAKMENTPRPCFRVPAAIRRYQYFRNRAYATCGKRVKARNRRKEPGVVWKFIDIRGATSARKKRAREKGERSLDSRNSVQHLPHLATSLAVHPIPCLGDGNAGGDWRRPAQRRASTRAPCRRHARPGLPWAGKSRPREIERRWRDVIGPIDAKVLFFASAQSGADAPRKEPHAQSHRLCFAGARQPFCNCHPHFCRRRDSALHRMTCRTAGPEPPPLFGMASWCLQ